MNKLIVGYAPTILGEYDIVCPEMMFVQDMPVIMPGSDLRLPKNLSFIEPLFEKYNIQLKRIMFMFRAKACLPQYKVVAVRGGI